VLAQIRALPGVGIYTAGALASLCADRPVPAVDANVLRVMLRLWANTSDRTSPSTLRWATAQAQKLHDTNVSQPGVGRAGMLNEGLIELGAVVCTPRAPRCGDCPLRVRCRAFAQGLVDQIPRASPPAPRTRISCASVLVRDARGRVLIDRRPSEGLWGDLYQAPTLESFGRVPTASDLRRYLPLARTRRLFSFEFMTTHRTLRFDVYEGVRTPGARLAGRGRRWMTRAEIASLALSSPQRRILLGQAQVSMKRSSKAKKS